MAPTKEYRCIVCDETDEDKFYANSRKSLCKEHFKVKKTSDIRKLILKPYDCKYCHIKDEKEYHPHCKNKCKEHYNTKGPPVEIKKKKKKQIVVVRPSSA